MNLINLSKLADSEANAPQLFSAVYTNKYIKKKVASRCPLNASTNSYTRKKVASRSQLYADPKEHGRSMVEMLGVLAIVGVLSVGAIAGYSKAMMKYKLNKQAEQLNTLINAVARNMHSFDNIQTTANSTTPITKYFTKMGEIPKEMLTPYENYLNDIFKTEIYIAINTAATLNNKNMAIFFMLDRLKTKSSENLEICKNIVLTAKENRNSIQYIEVVGDYSISDSYDHYAVFGDSYCSASNTCLKNITLDNIYTMCTKLVGKQQTHLVIVWKI